MSIGLFMECIKLWWDPTYSSWMFFALFLPVTMAVYTLVKKEGRYLVLLGASWIFFISFSGWLFTIHILETVFAWRMGLLLQQISGDDSLKRKEKSAKKKKVLAIGIVCLVLVLFVLKYLDFTGSGIVRLINCFRVVKTEWRLLNIVAPIGISYFTLEAISYLTDIYWDKLEAEKDYTKVALYMGFFPKLIEGPITRYGEIKDSLFAGIPVSYENLTGGYQRILLGLFKKLLIADHLAPAVDIVYNWENMKGSVALFGAVIFTIQEYMDFSGSIDIVIGAARVFGVKLSENFRQPFFAKNASDFWHRWHITLGTFFRDYIFYPVSVSKGVMKLTKKVKNTFGMELSRLTGPSIAIFCVWITNGIWHGPKWTYIFYGVYYFVLIFLENLVEKPFLSLLDRLKMTERSLPVRIFRSVKLFFIVIFGEMFFRAEALSRGFSMFKLILTDFDLQELTGHMGEFGMDFHDYMTVTAAFLLIMLFNVLKEKNVPFDTKFRTLPKPVRWTAWYVIIMVIVVFGAYGSGYDAAGMIYAKF
ncbi:MAG: MBOAT family protein [Lachnospiraceae bacterium]|nr:MBOAT family protein [Lachnospiraceae bacterium]